MPLFGALYEHKNGQGIVVEHVQLNLLLAYSTPSHYLNQCLLIVNCTLRNKLQWIFNQNLKLFIHISICRLRNGRPFCSGGDESKCGSDQTPICGNACLDQLQVHLFNICYYTSGTNWIILFVYAQFVQLSEAYSTNQHSYPQFTL